MNGTGWGVLGAVGGIVAGGTAALRAHVLRSRAVASAPVQPAVAVREVFRADGVERFIYVRAAAWSFLVVLAAVGVIGALDSTLGWTDTGRWIFGAVWGVGGAAFGVASALIARRTA